MAQRATAQAVCLTMEVMQVIARALLAIAALATAQSMAAVHPFQLDAIN